MELGKHVLLFADRDGGEADKGFVWWFVRCGRVGPRRRLWADNAKTIEMHRNGPRGKEHLGKLADVALNSPPG